MVGESNDSNQTLLSHDELASDDKKQHDDVYKTKAFWQQPRTRVDVLFFSAKDSDVKSNDAGLGRMRT